MRTDIISLLKKVGAILTNDHFIYTSGKHGSVYINKDALYPHTEETSQIGKMFRVVDSVKRGATGFRGQ